MSTHRHSVRPPLDACDHHHVRTTPAIHGCEVLIASEVPHNKGIKSMQINTFHFQGCNFYLIKADVTHHTSCTSTCQAPAALGSQHPEPCTTAPVQLHLIALVAPGKLSCRHGGKQRQNEVNTPATNRLPWAGGSNPGAVQTPGDLAQRDVGSGSQGALPA